MGFWKWPWLGVVDAVRARGANVICFAGSVVGDVSPNRNRRKSVHFRQNNVLFDLVDAKRLDGLIVWSSAIDGIIGGEGMQHFCQQYRPLPVVVVERQLDGFPSLLMEDYAGVYAAMSHFINEHGYRRIAFISGAKNHVGAQERYRAYAEALAHHGLPLDPTLVVPPTSFWDDAECKVVFAQWLDACKPDFEALMGVNDAYTMHALDVLAARGIRVPDDVAAAGFDAQPESASLIVPLTTVRPPFYELGMKAAEMVLDMASGQPVANLVTLPTELLVRQSCGCFASSAVRSVTGPLNAMPQGVAARKNVAGQHPGVSLAEVARLVEENALTIAPENAKRLLDDVLADAAGQSKDRFLTTLDRLLRDASMEGDGRTVTWHQSLSTLRQHLLVRLVESGLELVRPVEDLWHQGQILVGETEQRAEMRQAWQSQQQTTAFRRLGQSLITTFDVDELMDVVARELPRLGIRRCYLALYENPAEPTEQARLIMAYDEYGRVDLPPGGQIFAAHELLPRELWRLELLYNLIVEALFFNEQQLGFVLFEANSREDWVYETLRAELSSSLKGALLVKQTDHARAAAEQARAAAEEANTFKSHFLANMSHELRTPLNAILNFTRFMGKERYGPLNTRQIELQQRVLVNADHLLGLINDVLDLSKVESGRMDLFHELVDLDPLLRGVMATASGLTKDKGIELTLDCAEVLPPLWIDKTRIRQVLLNLLSNAAKFTEQGEITLRVSADDAYIQLSVQDTGIGIAQEHQALVFEEFRQVHNGLTRQYQGTGLGLAISKRLVELHDGRMWLESTPGEGSTFYFVLPVSCPVIPAALPKELPDGR